MDKGENELVLARWAFVSSDVDVADIIPDGCRDLIVRTRPGQRPELILTALDDHRRKVSIVSGEQLTGVRFRPGVRIDEDRLLQSPPTALLELDIDRLDGLAPPTAVVVEALQRLAQTEMDDPFRTVGRLHPRSLQRLMKGETGRSPGFWRRLARARHAGRDILAGSALGDVWTRFGFADQPHLTRELRRWFDQSPARLRSDAGLANRLRDVGYG